MMELSKKKQKPQANPVPWLKAKLKKERDEKRQRQEIDKKTGPMGKRD